MVNSNGKFMIGVILRVGICGFTKTGSDTRVMKEKQARRTMRNESSCCCSAVYLSKGSLCGLWCVCFCVYTDAVPLSVAFLRTFMA